MKACVLTPVTALDNKAQLWGWFVMRKLLAVLGGGSGAVAAGAIGAVLLAAAGWVQYNRGQEAPDRPIAAALPQDGDTSEPGDVADAARPVESTEQATPSETAQTTAPSSTSEDTVAALVFPAFDEVRREQDGMTIIAGSGVPGAVIQILQNGAKIESATVDGTGNFAAFAMIPPDGQGHVLSLVQQLGDQQVASEDEIILAPIAAPVATADVATEASETSQVAEAPDAKPSEDSAGVDVASALNIAPAKGEEPAVPTNEAVVGQNAAPSASSSEGDNAAADTELAVVVQADTAPQKDSIVTSTEAVAEDRATDVATATDAPPLADITDKSDTATAVAPAVLPDEDMQGSSTETAALAPTASIASTQPETIPSDKDDVFDSAASPPTTSVAVLKSTKEGVELLNPTAPEVMDNVALDTISYSGIGDVQLAGRAPRDAEEVRVYLDNRAIVSLPVDAEGRWRGDLPDVDEGVYTLRVDEVAADGSVSSRVETPFKREAPAVLAAASADQDGPLKAITVQRGNTLWAIARDRYGEGKLYVRVFEANRGLIRNPDLIYPGQVFTLPD